ncbi:hypothetical protein NQP46_10035 [Streptomyces albus]|nr:hypothetical protein NQP46_10035 [Streptomyces albus]
MGAAELAEFEKTYELRRAGLQAAYDSYCQERNTREAALTTLRAAAAHASPGSRMSCGPSTPSTRQPSSTGGTTPTSASVNCWARRACRSIPASSTSVSAAASSG